MYQPRPQLSIEQQCAGLILDDLVSGDIVAIAAQTASIFASHDFHARLWEDRLIWTFLRKQKLSPEKRRKFWIFCFQKFLVNWTFFASFENEVLLISKVTSLSFFPLYAENGHKKLLFFSFFHYFTLTFPCLLTASSPSPKIYLCVCLKLEAPSKNHLSICNGKKFGFFSFSLKSASLKMQLDFERNRRGNY